MKIRLLPFVLSATLAGSCSPGLGPVVPETPVERKMIGLLQKFDRWDDDGDGELDHAELDAGLKGTEHKPERVIAFYDTDGNGRVSLREAQAGYARSGEAEKQIAARKAATP
jgi:hypothetical protein